MAAAASVTLARQLFAQHNYAGCAQALQAITEATSDPAVLAAVTPLQTLATGYHLWDQFRHADAFEKLKSVGGAGQMALAIDLQPNLRFLAAVCRARAKHAECCRTGGEAGAACRLKYDLRLAADIVSNADRRLAMGRHDDAIARLYRALELVAQAALAQLDPPIDAACVRLDDLPTAARAEFAPRCDEDGTFRSTLATDFRVLALRPDPWGLGEWFAATPALRQGLFARNHSILAHGLDSVKPETVAEFRGLVVEAARRLDGQFDQWREDAQFRELPAPDARGGLQSPRCSR